MTQLIVKEKKSIATVLLVLFAATGLFSQTPIADNLVVNGTVQTSAKRGDTLIFGGRFTHVGRNTGGFARIRKSDGLVDQSFPRVAGYVYVIVPDGSGGWYVGGSFTQVGQQACSNIAHINSDFSVENWAPAVNNTVRSIYLRSTTLLIGGEFTSVNSTPRNYVAEISKINNGQLTSFDIGLPGLTPFSTGGILTIVRYGTKIYMGTDRILTIPGFGTRTAVFALNENDLTVSAWAPVLQYGGNGILVKDIHPYQNTIVLAGHFTVGTIYNVAQFDTTTASIGSLSLNHNSSYYPLSSSRIVNDKIYISGSFDYPSKYLACYNMSDNSWVSTWTPNLNGGNLEVIDNHIIQGYPHIQKIDLVNGSIDSSCTPKLDQPNSFNSIKDDGTHYIIGGQFSLTNATEANGIALINAATNTPLDWQIHATAGNGVYGSSAVYDMQLEGDVLYFGGTFGFVYTSAGGYANRYCAAAVNLKTGAIQSWDALLGGYVGCSTPFVSGLHVGGQSVYLCGNFTVTNGNSAYNLWRAYDKTTGALKPEFAPDATGDNDWCDNRHFIYDMQLIPQGLLVWGDLATVDGQPRNGIALLDPVTGVGKAMDLKLQTNAIVKTAAFYQNKLIIAGNFDSLGIRKVDNIAVLDTMKWSPSPLTISADSTIDHIDIDNNTLYLFGQFQNINNQLFSGVAAFDMKEHTLYSWNPNLPNRNTTANKVLYTAFFTSLLHKGKLYLGGYFTFMGSTVSPYLVAWQLSLTNTFTVTGRVFDDANHNCALNIGEKTIEGILIKATPGDYYATTGKSGNYYLTLPYGSYTLSQIFLGRDKDLVNAFCAPTKNVTGNAIVRRIDFVDFADTVRNCYYVDMEIKSAARRRCSKTVSTIKYFNSGNQTAYNLTLKVMPSPFIKPLISTPAWTSNTNDTLIYTIASLAPRQEGYITLLDSNKCIEATRGSTQCIKALLSPASACMPSSTVPQNWDRSSIHVSGSCIGDSVEFKIGNEGTGNMAGTSEYRIYFDQVLGYTNSFQLNTNQTLFVLVKASSKTIRLEADQRPFHPGQSKPRATVEDCGTVNSIGVESYRIGMPVEVPLDDAAPEHAEACQIVVDSYDPNDKNALPSGMSTEKIVVPGVGINYTIRFQNTGTAEAIHVRLVDTLDTAFDPSRITFLGASHPGSAEITGNGTPILEWNFPGIYLLPASQDSVASQGFVSFFVAPKAGTTLGTYVYNKADIYFDYNSAIRTNTVTLKYDAWAEEDGTLGANVSERIVTVVNDKVYKRETIGLYPNPATDRIRITGIPSGYLEHTISSVQGVLYSLPFKQYEQSMEIETNNLPVGWYSIQIKTDQTSYHLTFLKSK